MYQNDVQFLSGPATYAKIRSVYELYTVGQEIFAVNEHCNV